MPRIKAVLEEVSESPSKLNTEVALPGIQKQYHPVVKHHLYPIVRMSDGDEVRLVTATHGKVGNS